MIQIYKTNHAFRVLTCLFLSVFLFVAGYTVSNAQTPYPEITSIYWSDGDSGRINGTLKFRLANIDAPETGGVGARGGAKCETERVLGYEAKAYIVNLTRSAELEITKDYGTDRYGRLVIDLSVNGTNIGDTGLQSKFLKGWPHRGRKALSRKPDWCG